MATLGSTDSNIVLATGGVGVHAYTAASQSITATTYGSGDTVTFVALVDLGGDYSSNTFTAPVAGFYLFDVALWATSVHASLGSTLILNLNCSTLGDQPFAFSDSGGNLIDIGSSRTRGSNAGSTSVDPYEVGLNRMVYLAASETVTVEALHESGGQDLTISEKRLTIALLAAGA